MCLQVILHLALQIISPRLAGSWFLHQLLQLLHLPLLDFLNFTTHHLKHFFSARGSLHVVNVSIGQLKEQTISRHEGRLVVSALVINSPLLKRVLHVCVIHVKELYEHLCYVFFVLISQLQSI